jgi:hypothetical protein
MRKMEGGGETEGGGEERPRARPCFFFAGSSPPWAQTAAA